MDVRLSDEQRMLYETIRNFAFNEVFPTSVERDEAQAWSPEIWKRMAELGLLGIIYPEEYGGGGADCLTTCVAMEAFARGGADAGTGLSWGASTILCGVPIWRVGSEEQRRRYLPRLSDGSMIGGFCLSEPDAGSDAASMRTTAVKKGDRYILNGTKMWITNGPQGDVFVVTAKTAPEQKAFGISTFIVEKDFPGFHVSRKLSKLGNRTSPTAEIVLENCEVPEENLLGPENFGFVQVAKLILGYERTCLVAPTIGGMEAGLEASARYALDRPAFRKTISDFDAVRHKLAEMRLRAEIARNLIYYGAWCIDQGDDNLVEAAIAKISATESALFCADAAIQIHGGYGYIKEFPVERGWRDAKLGTIGGGTSEIQRSIIARGIMNF
jgi:alkylation response protein AidB-like acyl-CoA dehydrogenase